MSQVNLVRQVDLALLALQENLGSRALLEPLAGVEPRGFLVFRVQLALLAHQGLLALLERQYQFHSL